MRKYIIYSLVSLLFFGSCSTLTKTTNSSNNEIKAFESGLVMRPLLADLEVENTRKSVEYIVPDYMSIKKDGKQNALLAFKKAHKCDYVVDPIFEIATSKGRINEVKITLSGYSATYSNIRQVDTLPKSITQFNILNKSVKELDYLNSFSDIEPTMGVEFMTLQYNGFQFDKVLTNSKNRFYFGLESNRLESNSSRLNADFYFEDLGSFDVSDSLMGALNNEILTSQNTFSLGLMRELTITNFLKFRIVGGLNLLRGKVSYDEYDLTLLGGYSVNNSGLNGFVSEYTCSSFGVRVGAAADIKIYKSLSAVIKMHYNQDLLRFLSKNDALTFAKYNSVSNTFVDGDYKIKKVKFDYGSRLNLAAGVRIVF